MIKNSTRLIRPRSDWWEVWTAGAIAQILYNAFSMQLYHYYIYFYIVGLILLADSLIGWGSLNANGIKIRLGIGFKSNLYFEWKDILKVEVVNFKRTSIITSGGLSKIPYVADFYIRALVLTSCNGFSQELKTKIQAIRKRSIFKEKVALDCQKNKVIFFEKPEGGFIKVVSTLKSYENLKLKIDVEKNKKDKSTRLQINRKLKFLIDFLVVVFTIGTIFYYSWETIVTPLTY